MLEDISDTAALEQLLVETEKQAAMAQLAAGILHEVANPLTSLGSNLLFVRGALERSQLPDVTQALDVSLEQLDQIRQLLGTLSGFPGRSAPRYEVVDVHELVRRCVIFVAKEAECRRIGLGVSFAASALVCEIDVRLIKQVLINLLKNAMEAMPTGGRIDVRTSHRVATTGEPAAVLIEIADTGVAIPESDLRKGFRPLFSTKPRGAGLGLSFCRQTVEDHGGEIRLTSRGKGARHRGDCLASGSANADAGRLNDDRRARTHDRSPPSAHHRRRCWRAARCRVCAGAPLLGGRRVQR
jgi:signal transduction histidine kinase